MALSLPYPGQPATNSALSSLPVQANITAIAQAIQSFDGSQITAGSVSASALAANINPNTLLHDTISSFVQSGCVWSSVSGLVGTMTGGTIYVGPSTATYRVTVNGVGSHTFTASQDTYIDIDYNGNIAYSAVSNGSNAPSLTANSIRVAKVITSGSAITSVAQTGTDSNNVQIYPVSPYGMGNWISWTPTWVNLTPGNGTVVARYTQIGKTVFFHLQFTWGSTTSIGASDTLFTLPVTAHGSYNKEYSLVIGQGTVWRSGAYPILVGTGSSTSTAVIQSVKTNGGAGGIYGIEAGYTSSAPTTGWTTGDVIECSGTYEAA